MTSSQRCWTTVWWTNGSRVRIRRPLPLLDASSERRDCSVVRHHVLDIIASFSSVAPSSEEL